MSGTRVGVLWLVVSMTMGRVCRLVRCRTWFARLTKPPPGSHLKATCEPSVTARGGFDWAGRSPAPRASMTTAPWFRRTQGAA